MALGLEARLLSPHQTPNKPTETFSMATLTIDGKDYDTEQLSDAAKAQVTNVQLVDQKIAQLQQELAIMQTARNAYANALQAELPKES